MGVRGGGGEGVAWMSVYFRGGDNFDGSKDVGLITSAGQIFHKLYKIQKMMFFLLVVLGR